MSDLKIFAIVLVILSAVMIAVTTFCIFTIVEDMRDVLYRIFSEATLIDDILCSTKPMQKMCNNSGNKDISGIYEELDNIYEELDKINEEVSELHCRLTKMEEHENG